MPDLQFVAWATLRIDAGADLAATVPWLPPLPPGFPLPAEGNELRLEIAFESAGRCHLRLSSRFQLDRDAELAGLQLGRELDFAFTAALDTAALGAALDGSLPAVSGELTLRAAARLPALPALGPLHLHAGAADGWLHAEFSGTVSSTGTLDLALRLGSGELGLDLALPGSAADAPPIFSARFDTARLAIAAGAQTLSATLAVSGQATLTPVLPGDEVPFAHQWRQLLAAHLAPLNLGCSAAITLGREGAGVAIELHGAELELRPLAAIVGLANAAGAKDADAQLPLELPLRFVLRGAQVQVGRALADLRFELGASLGIGAAPPAQVSVGVVGGAFRIGIGQIAIPLALPPCPLSVAEFDELYEPEAEIDPRIDQRLAAAGCPAPSLAAASETLGATCRRLHAQRWLLHAFHAIPRAAQQAGRPMDADAKSRYRAWLRLLVASIELASAKPDGDAAYRVTPAARAALAALPMSEALPTETLNLLPDAGQRHIGRGRLDTALRNRIGAAALAAHGDAIADAARIRGASMVGQIAGREHVLLENLTLRIEWLKFEVPLATPNQVRASGEVQLSAYSEPLGAVDIALELGVSADMVFFSLKSVDGRVPIPDVGRYTGGSLRFSRFLIGLGLTRRSLALAFAGEVVLPEQLVADLETSDVTLLGVRLPVQTQLNFRLDLVPVPAPNVVIIVPMFQFNLDLRRAGRPALADAARCLPDWDGLQFIAPGFRFGLKHVAFSAVFGFLPAWNWVLGGDLVIGGNDNGLAVVIDEWMQIDAFWTPTSVKIALPGFSDDTPFVHNACIELRVAGFGLHLHLQRPFPSLSPLALPELFALLSAPDTYPVNPRGELANSLRISLLDSGIRLPAPLLALFPALRAVAGPPVSATLNLGSFITLSQKVFAVVAPVLREVIDRVRAAAQDPQALRRAFTPPPFKPRDLLQGLPPTLRRLESQARFGPFEGQALLVLLSAAEARQALDDRRAAAPPRAPLAGLAPGQAFAGGDLARFAPRVEGASTGPTSAVDLLDDPVFDAFTGADLRLSAFSGLAGGMLVAARLALCGDQRLKFIGLVLASGRFMLVAAAEAPPLKLHVAGIDLPLPFEATGRITLGGTALPGTVDAELKAQGSAKWALVPGQLEANLDAAKLAVGADARFAVRGKLVLSLFGGRLVGRGSIDVTPDRARVAARFAFDQGPLSFDIQGTGLLGPLHVAGTSRAGARIDVTALGSGTLYGGKLTDLRAHLTGERIDLQARWRPSGWALFASSATLKADLALAGSFWFPTAAPAMALEGDGRIGIQWQPRQPSPADVTLEGRARFESGPGRNRLEASGTLFWLGRQWATATLVATPGGVSLSGHTAFSLELPPRGLLPLPRMPRLVLRLDIAGRFELDGTGVISGFAFDAHWLVGARLQDDSDQLFTLAAGGRRFDSGDAGLERTLLHARALQLLPGGEQGLSIWQPATAAPSLIDIGKSLTDGNDTAVHFNLPDHDKSLRLRATGFTVGIGRATYQVQGPDVPELKGGNDVDMNASPLRIFPLEPQPLRLPWPAVFAPEFSLALTTAGRELVLRLDVGGVVRRFRLRDGTRIIG